MLLTAIAPSRFVRCPSFAYADHSNAWIFPATLAGFDILMARRRLSRQQLNRIGRLQDQRRQRAGERAEELAATTALGAEQTGLVIAHYGTNAVVEDAAGALHRCALRQNLPALVCGDRVIWQRSGPGEGVVVAVNERHSLLTRPDYSGRIKPVAANVDEVVVVIAPQPEPNEYLIDRYLVAIETIGVAALIVLNKVDLLNSSACSALLERLSLYPRIGYPLVTASTRSAHGLDALRGALSERTSILVGQSGVGKSSLIKTLLPEREIRIQALSETTGLGTHTTTSSMLYHVPTGGDLIDSPGVRSFELGELSQAQLTQGFVEFQDYLGRCRFANCNHTVEPGCALIAASRCGAIDPRRLTSFRQLQAGLTERRY